MRISADRSTRKDAPVPSRPRRGSRLGKYRLIRPLGRGAFAEVWKARDLVESRDVALKMMRDNGVVFFKFDGMGGGGGTGAAG